MKKIITIITVIALVFATLTGCASYDKEFYSPENTNIELAFLFDISTEMPANEVDPTQDTNPYPNPWEYYLYDGEMVEIVGKKLSAFFDEVYNISIEDKLAHIETRVFYDTGEVDGYERMNGYSVPGENIVYLNEYVLGESIDLFASTWVHEAIHSMGLDFFNTSYSGLYETITEAVNHQFLDWAGYKTFTSAYTSGVPIGTMIIELNPDIVANSLIDDNFLIEEEINRALADATYTMAVPLEGESIAYHLSQALSHFYSPIMAAQMEPIEKFMTLRAIQEITVAYCRTFGLTNKQIKKLERHWNSDEFAFQWILKS